MEIFIDYLNDELENECHNIFGISKLESIVNRAVTETLTYENFPTENVEVSILIVDGQYIKELNKNYRNIDKVTDVLSFPLLDEINENINSFNSEQPIALGDIVICLEKTISQAEQLCHSAERELAFLTAHSMLHLLGYDHMEASEEEVMLEKQREILKWTS